MSFRSRRARSCSWSRWLLLQRAAADVPRTSLRTRSRELGRLRRQSLFAQCARIADDGARDVAGLLLDGLVGVQRFVTRRAVFVLPDIPVAPRLVAGIDQSHPVQPVGQCTARGLDTSDVAVDDKAVDAMVQMLWIVPAPQLERLGFVGVLAV